MACNTGYAVFSAQGALAPPQVGPATAGYISLARRDQVTVQLRRSLASRERERKENTRSSYRPCSSFPSLPSSQAHFSRRSDAVDSSVNMLVTRTRGRARIVARRRGSWMGLARKWIINILAGESVIVRCLRTSVEGRVPLSARAFHPSQLFLQAAQLCNRLNLCNES